MGGSHACGGTGGRGGGRCLQSAHTSMGMSRSLTEKSSKAVKVDLRVLV